MMKTSPINSNQHHMKLTAQSRVMLAGHKVYFQGSHLLHQIFRDMSQRALSLSEGDIVNVPSLADTVNIPSLGDIVNVPYVPPRTRPKHTSDGEEPSFREASAAGAWSAPEAGVSPGVSAGVEDIAHT